MPSPFQIIADDSKKNTQSIENKLAIEHSPSKRFSNQNIHEWMEKGKKTKKSSICALFVGAPKVGKSGVLLDCRTDQDKIDGKKLIIFELNSDQGCDLNKKEFHANDDNIIILDPREYIQDKDGFWQPDYVATMQKIKAAIQTIKEDIERDENIKAIGFDGLDIFLSEICESQMRLEEHIDAAGGVAVRFWKNRNKYYYDVINMILGLDVDKYFITHYTPRLRDEKTGQFIDRRTVSKLNDLMVYSCQKSTSDKMHQIVEFSDQTKIIAGKKDIKIVVTMIADRRNLNSYMNNITIAETINGKVRWNGQSILERTWS